MKHIYCYLVLFIFNATYLGAQDLSNGLIAHYKLNGDFTDASGNGNNGTNSGATFSVNRNNFSLKASDFNGTNQSVVINNSTSLSQISNEITMTVWARIEGYDRAIDNKDYAVLLCKANNENKAQFRIALTPNSYSIINNGKLGEVSSSKPIALNKWVHLAAVIKDSLAKVYLDGELVGTNVLGSTYGLEKNSPLTLGRDDAGGVEFFDGKLDDIRIYNRAVSDQEISSIYNTLDYTIDSNTLDLIAYYPFDGNLNDFSGNLNHGTAFGGTYVNDRLSRNLKAYSFNGMNQYIEIENSPSLESPVKQITMATWVNVSQFYKGIDNLDYAVLLCKSNSSSSAQYRLALTRNGISVINNSILGSVSGPISFDLNKWYHVVSVIEDTLITYYLNGQLVGSNVATNSFGMSKNNKLYLGRDEPGGMDYFNGILDETKIYARKLLPYEITNMYNEGLANGIGKVDLSSSINMYPNPSNGIIRIESEKFSIDEITVYDVNGREMSFQLLQNGASSQLTLLDFKGNSIVFVKIRVGNQIITKHMVVSQ
jgi:hypothetical protein